MGSTSPMRLAALPALFAAALGLGGCSALDLLDAVVPAGGYRAETGIAYGEDPRQRLDVYRPEEGTAAAAPVIVFLYGGNWQSGDRALYRFIGQAFATQGFVTVIPDYRLYPAVRFPAFVEDAAAAVAWAARNAGRFGGDPRRLFLVGHSAGAHSVAMLALDRRFLQAAGLPPHGLAGAVGLAGPYDFEPTGETRTILAVGSAGRSAMPADFARGDAPPMLLMTGSDDDTVSPANSRKLGARLAAAAGTVEVIEYPGIGHAGIVAAMAAPLTLLAPVRRDLLAWLRARS
jgi:acetyl esterase/lipase